MIQVEYTVSLPCPAAEGQSLIAVDSDNRWPDWASLRAGAFVGWGPGRELPSQLLDCSSSVAVAMVF